MSHNLFQKDPILHDKVDKVMQHVIDKGIRGVNVTYERIEQLTGISQDDVKWESVRRLVHDQARKVLGVTTISISNESIYFETVAEQLQDAPIRRLSRSETQVDRAIDEVSMIGPDDLSEHQRVGQSKSKSVLKRTKAHIGAHKIEHDALYKKEVKEVESE